MHNDNIQDAIGNKAKAMVTICPLGDAVMCDQTSKAGLPKIFITDHGRMALGEISWPVN
jgi:hypothetical protein